MTKLIPALALIGLFAAFSVGPAQERQGDKVTRTHFTLKNGDAAVLAEVLNKHFKGDAEILALPPTSGNGLLISASPTVTTEVHKLLAQLDHGARAVEIEVSLVEVFAKKAPFEKDATEGDFTGTAAEVFAKLDGLGKTGQIGPVQRIKLMGVEGQPLTVTTGGNKPIVTGTVRGGKGAAGGFAGGTSVTYQQIGTTARATPRVTAEGVVVVDLDLKDSRVRVPEGAGAGAAGADEPPEFLNTTLASKVTVPPGRAVVAQAVRSEGKSGGTIALVIVTARVVEAGK
jgi:type II secretory pathway component GspD/PulD (secretin)